MPHTTTKNHRTKRVDTRPNAKIRAKTQRQHNDQLKIQDIRVTRKGKEERIERELNVSQSSSLATLSKDEKLLRALKKKLRGINDLIEKSKKGEDLNPLQRAKVDQLDVVLEDMEALLQKTKQRAHLQADGSSEEEEDDEIEGEEEMEEADR